MVGMTTSEFADVNVGSIETQATSAAAGVDRCT